MATVTCWKRSWTLRGLDSSSGTARMRWPLDWLLTPYPYSFLFLLNSSFHLILSYLLISSYLSCYSLLPQVHTSRWPHPIRPRDLGGRIPREQRLPGLPRQVTHRVSIGRERELPCIPCRTSDWGWQSCCRWFRWVHPLRPAPLHGVREDAPEGL